ncbi:hypothetical protein ACGFYU_27580 [Streptomyces sp. NPDC048337]|uniref:hypothetical protein n=1 Tax=Streptomyces sp. NPDC048337 TaxID=3365535 RepID=UPI0037201E9B
MTTDAETRDKARSEGARSDYFAVGAGAEPDHCLRGFASPVTRKLLSSKGLTVTLLETLNGTPVHLSDVRIQQVPASQASPVAATLLGADDSCVLLVRHSRLTDPKGQLLSVNHVVARTDLDCDVQRCLNDLAAPLGAALRSVRGTTLHRAVRYVGRTGWPPNPTQSAAFRIYLLSDNEGPLAAIREVFDPTRFPATAAHPAPARGRNL